MIAACCICFCNQAFVQLLDVLPAASRVYTYCIRIQQHTVSVAWLLVPNLEDELMPKVEVRLRIRLPAV